MNEPKTPSIASWVHKFTARPALTLLFLLLSIFAALWLASGLQIQSSRHALVSPDHPYQARLLSLVDDFGLPDDLIFWVQGGSAVQRRAAIDALQEQLQAQGALAHARFTGSPQIEDWAPLYAVQHPNQLKDILAGLASPEKVKAALDKGLVGILDLSLAQVDSEQPARLPEPDQLRQSTALIESLKQLMQGASLDELSAQLIARRENSGGATPNTVVALDEAGYLRNDDASALLLVVSNALQNDQGDTMQEVVQASRAAQQAVAKSLESGVQIRLSGYPVLQVDEQAAIARGLLNSSAATGLGIVLVLAMAFSSLRKSVIALIPLGAGAALSLGALQLLFGQVNAITSSFLAVLLGLGIDISVHFLARVDEGLEQAPTEQSRGVIAQAFAASGPAVVIGTLTTALAFLLLYGAEFAAYGELGVITALGLLLMLICAFLAIPALLLLWPGRATASSARAKGQAWLGALAQRVVQAPRLLVGMGLLAALAGAYFGAGLNFNPRYFDFMPRRLESVALLERLEQESVASPLAVSVRASSLQDAEQKAKTLRASSLVAAVQSPSDLLAEQSSDFAALEALKAWWPAPKKSASPNPEELRKAVQERALAFVDALDEQLFRLSMQRSKQQAELVEVLKAWKAQWSEIEALARTRPESGPALAAAQSRVESIRQSISQVLASPALANREWRAQDLPVGVAARFVGKDAQAGLRLLVTPAGDFWAPGRAQQFLDFVQEVDPRSAGHSMSVIIHSSMIRRDFFRASAWALLVISLLLWVIFRSFKTLLMVIVPLAVGWCWMLGAYALLGIQLNAANIVVLPLVLGIGVDAGVHLMHRAQEESQDRVGIVAAVASTGSAVTICALTTMVGFGGLMVAEYGGMKSLGLSMVIGIFTTWLSTVVLMPALLSLFRAER